MSAYETAYSETMSLIKQAGVSDAYKTRSLLQKLLGGHFSTLGAARAMELSPLEANVLKQTYGLHPNADLASRNAWRSVAGGTIGQGVGALAGGIGGATLGGLLAGEGGAAGLGMLAAAPASILGALKGSMLATKKYSKEEAERIMAAAIAGKK